MAFDLVLLFLLRSGLPLSFSKNADSKAADKIMSERHFIDYIVFDMHRLTEPVGSECTTFQDVIPFFFL